LEARRSERRGGGERDRQGEDGVHPHRVLPRVPLANFTGRRAALLVGVYIAADAH
jgi:hypothetical protein